MVAVTWVLPVMWGVRPCVCCTLFWSPVTSLGNVSQAFVWCLRCLILLWICSRVGSITPATDVEAVCVFIGSRQRKGKYLLSIINWCYSNSMLRHAYLLHFCVMWICVIIEGELAIGFEIVHSSPLFWCVAGVECLEWWRKVTMTSVSSHNLVKECSSPWQSENICSEETKLKRSTRFFLCVLYKVVLCSWFKY